MERGTVEPIAQVGIVVLAVAVSAIAPKSYGS